MTKREWLRSQRACIGLLLYGSFDYAQDDETGAVEEAVGVLRAVAVWRTLFLQRFPLARHPERSRRIQQH